MYGLSAVFRVVDAGDATLSDLTIEGTTGRETVNLTPTFDADTLTYTASVPYGIDTVTLTAATTDSEAMVVISNDDDTSSKNEAELELNVGDTILTVTVTSQDAFRHQNLHDHSNEGRRQYRRDPERPDDRRHARRSNGRPQPDLRCRNPHPHLHGCSRHRD